MRVSQRPRTNTHAPKITTAIIAAVKLIVPPLFLRLTLRERKILHLSCHLQGDLAGKVRQPNSRHLLFQASQTEIWQLQFFVFRSFLPHFINSYFCGECPLKEAHGYSKSLPLSMDYKVKASLGESSDGRAPPTSLGVGCSQLGRSIPQPGELRVIDPAGRNIQAVKDAPAERLAVAASRNRHCMVAHVSVLFPSALQLNQCRGLLRSLHDFVKINIGLVVSPTAHQNIALLHGSAPFTFFLGVEPAFNADSPKGFHHVKKPLGGICSKACQREKKEKSGKRACFRDGMTRAARSKAGNDGAEVARLSATPSLREGLWAMRVASVTKRPKRPRDAEANGQLQAGRRSCTRSAGVEGTMARKMRFGRILRFHKILLIFLKASRLVSGESLA